MARVRPKPPDPEVARLVAAYGVSEAAAAVIIAYIDTGREIDAAERSGLQPEEVARLLSRDELARKVLAEEIRHRFQQGAVIGYRALMELAQGGSGAVRLAAAKVLVERQFGKEAGRLDIHVHRDEGELMSRIGELMQRLGLREPPVVVEGKFTNVPTGDLGPVQLPALIPGKEPAGVRAARRIIGKAGRTIDMDAVLAGLDDGGPEEEPWEKMAG